ESQAKLYKEEKKTYTLTAADDLKVRLLQPPLRFDDKGAPVKYTAEELKEMRAKDKLPGYAGESENLKAGQIVSVSLARKKDAPKINIKDKDKDPDKFNQAIEDSKPVVRMIVVKMEPKDN